MKIPFLDLKSQYTEYKESALSAVMQVMDEQSFVLGSHVASFEQDLGNYLNLPAAVGVSSGTDALLIALMTLNIGPGDEVVIPALSFFATAGVVARLGARPIFADINPDTFNLESNELKAVLNHRTKVVIPVHLFGQIARLDQWYQQNPEDRPWIIEDAAQALGATLHGRGTGHLGDLACTSFFPTKNLGGFGDGGAVYGRDQQLLNRVRMLRVHGAQKKYHHTAIGGNFRLDAIQAAVLTVKLNHLQRWNQARQANAAWYNEFFANAQIDPPLLRMPIPSNESTHIYHQYVIRSTRRDQLKERLKKAGIDTMIYYPSPLHLQPCFSELGYRKGQLPEAERACEEVLALPVHPTLRLDQREYIAEQVCLALR